MNILDVESFIDFCDNELITVESLRSGNSLKYTKLLKRDIPKTLHDTEKSNYDGDKIIKLEETLILIDDAIDELSHLEPDMLDKALAKGSELAYIIGMICRSKSIIGELDHSINSSMITKITRFLVERYIMGIPVRKLSINEKKRVIDKKIQALRDYREIVNNTLKKLHMTSNVTESYELMVCESNNAMATIGKTIINGVQTLIYKLKTLIQRIESWINEKLFKLLKCEYIQIDIDYYTQSINLINRIKNSKESMNTWLKILKTNMDAIRYIDNVLKYDENVHQLKNMYSMLESELKKMESLMDSEIVLKPKEQQKLIAISPKDINAIYAILNDNQTLSNYIMKQLIIFSRKLKSSSQTKEGICKLLSANFAALSHMQALKSDMCVKIVNGIMANGVYVNKGNRTV